jgi:ubiquitin-activating enzyme E1
VRCIQVVCVTEVPFLLQVQINEACATVRVTRKGSDAVLGPYYVQAESRGVFGRLFADFGEDFVVSDVNGEAPASAVIASIDKGNPGIVTTIPDELHDLQTGDYVTFTEVQGLEELNNCPPVQVTVINAHSFSIGDVSHLKGSHSMGGVFHQVKQPQSFSFQRWGSSCAFPASTLEPCPC